MMRRRIVGLTLALGMVCGLAGGAFGAAAEGAGRAQPLLTLENPDGETAVFFAGELNGETEQSAAAGPVYLDLNWTYADRSAIHTGAGELLLPEDGVPDRGITVCVNAGHGTQGGSEQQTLCHPDGTAKVTGGSTTEGAVYATAVSAGATFPDGTTEAEANLLVAQHLRDLLLADGYRVLMIRSGADVQLDNIARTVLANNCADCHIAIHFDSTETDKGAFYCSVPDNAAYRAMEPVASHWEAHERLGQSLIAGLGQEGCRLFPDGPVPTDLTQTSYSTVPSVDIELGDRASDHSDAACAALARGLKAGVDLFFIVE